MQDLQFRNTSFVCVSVSEGVEFARLPGQSPFVDMWASFSREGVA